MTDGDVAFPEAIVKVFGDRVFHRRCTYHMGKNLRDNLSRHYRTSPFVVRASVALMSGETLEICQREAEANRKKKSRRRPTPAPAPAEPADDNAPLTVSPLHPPQQAHPASVASTTFGYWLPYSARTHCRSLLNVALVPSQGMRLSLKGPLLLMTPLSCNRTSSTSPLK
eukprot:gnl/Ergobibamus_cyprinoides/374.p1 GENE.gnl/Ergobibamus_cyprinoides/374~~gnl/Ergobibamus_cyprinoides/374.p1  ORF type:complete len:169 (-),score=14.19 gnl/Ergobibamus_cyprinoides/374:226-732(-)